ncbi:hypothetical protein Scep_014159 [Stephania cephalantha]|uniref:galactinol--sucrose galactosyltransferase n=1 Tax=Stephania cephalantha TaxID=152367 RepID=A0AAP0J2J8_9MAGN
MATGGGRSRPGRAMWWWDPKLSRRYWYEEAAVEAGLAVVKVDREGRCGGGTRSDRGLTGMRRPRGGTGGTMRCEAAVKAVVDAAAVRVVECDGDSDVNLSSIKSLPELRFTHQPKMTVASKTSISNGNLVVHGKTILTGVPDNIVLTLGARVAGAFIGASASDSKSLHVFPIGTLEGLRFMCCFRFKLWWMTQRMGTCGRDVPLETQFMLIESKDETAETVTQEGDTPTIYTVLLPLLEGNFRAVLQGNDRNEIEICLESGDNNVQTNQGYHLVYMHTGTNPFEVINHALPSFVDWFGWCTWDAFYTDVTAEGVDEGLTSLTEGGTPPRFLIIDDGWQQIGNEAKESKDCLVQEGAQFASRLVGIKENEKFQKNGKKSEQVPGLKHVVDESKQHHNVKCVPTVASFVLPTPFAFVYVWHALVGYWGGVKPAADGMEHYDSALAYPVQSPGVLGNQPDIVMDSLAVHGLGLVPPKKVFNFYNELHAYLASCGVDGVKVDVQNIIETLGAGYGGRVALTRSYHQALEASISRNFPDNGCIAPTRDCLFADPARDGISLLKVWNVNKCSGLVGVFNCQGAGWCKVEKKTRIHDVSPGTLSSSVRTTDVDNIAQIAGDDWNGDAVVYAFKSGEIVRLPKGASLPVTLKVLDYELFHFCPVKEIADNISFAPIGLLDMFNASGALEQFEVALETKAELFDGDVSSESPIPLSESRSPTATISLKSRGCGRFGAYSSQQPLKVCVDVEEFGFNYCEDTGLLTFNLPVPEKEMYLWQIKIQV